MVKLRSEAQDHAMSPSAYNADVLYLLYKCSAETPNSQSNWLFLD